MEVRAKAKFLRISPRKLRLIARLLVGMAVAPARAQLNNLYKKGARPMLKLLDSAVANAAHNKKLKADNLFVKNAFVDEGPVIKRWRPRAFGRAGQIRKRMSHLTIILEEREIKKEKTSSQSKIPNPKSQIPNKFQPKADQPSAGKLPKAPAFAKASAGKQNSKQKAGKG